MVGKRLYFSEIKIGKDMLVLVPLGGDVAGVTEYLSKDWLDENFGVFGVGK
jgi:hypothetical protein